MKNIHKMHKINSYKILTIPVENSNIIYVQSFILSGRMNENKSDSGISHLLEHVLTESWKKCKDDCAKYWGKKGIITNASTGDSTINYYVEGLEKNCKELIEYIINITTKPQFREKRVKVEKRAVKEELTRELNDPGWKIADKISNIFYSHPGLKNSNNIPLQLKNLKTIQISDLIQYCNQIYTPKNILFVVSGDFNQQYILNLFERYLPKSAKLGKRNIQNNIYKKINKPVINFIPNKKAKISEIVISFMAKIYPQDNDAIYFPIISDILCGGMQSLLMRKLRTELNLIYNIRVYIEPEITGTLTTIETTGDQEKTFEIINSIVDVLKDMLNGKWKDAQLIRTIDRHLIRDEKICKNNIFLADYYAEQYVSQLYNKDPIIRSPAEQTKIIKKVTKKQIIATCKKIFPLNRMITTYQCRNKQR